MVDMLTVERGRGVGFCLKRDVGGASLVETGLLAGVVRAKCVDRNYQRETDNKLMSSREKGQSCRCGQRDAAMEEETWSVQIAPSYLQASVGLGSVCNNGISTRRLFVASWDGQLTAGS